MNGPGEDCEYSGGDEAAYDPARGEKRPRQRFVAAGEKNREDNEDRYRADVDQDLGETNELGTELEIESGQTYKRQHKGQRAMDKVAQSHCGQRSGYREHSDDGK